MKMVTVKCSNSSCPSYSDWSYLPEHKGQCLHVVQGQDDAGRQILQCRKCGTSSDRAAPERTINVKKRGYPYYNSSVGETFTCDSHEKAYVKANNLTKRE